MNIATLFDEKSNIQITYKSFTTMHNTLTIADSIQLAPEIYYGKEHMRIEYL